MFDFSVFSASFFTFHFAFFYCRMTKLSPVSEQKLSLLRRYGPTKLFLLCRCGRQIVYCSYSLTNLLVVCRQGTKMFLLSSRSDKNRFCFLVHFIGFSAASGCAQHFGIVFKHRNQLFMQRSKGALLDMGCDATVVSGSPSCGTYCVSILILF